MNGTMSWNPQSIALDRCGKFYITDRESNCVLVFSSEGEIRSRFSACGDGVSEHLQGCTLTPHNTLLVCDVKNNMIQEFSLSGKFIRSVEPPEGEKKFNIPLGVTMDRMGNMLVADSGNNRIVMLYKDGGLVIIETWGNGHQQFNSPCGVALTHNNDRIIVLDSNGIKIFKYPLT